MLCKHEDPSSESQHPWNKLGTVAHTCNFSTAEVNTGRSLHLAISAAWGTQWAPGSLRPCLKNIRWRVMEEEKTPVLTSATTSWTHMRTALHHGYTRAPTDTQRKDYSKAHLHTEMKLLRDQKSFWQQKKEISDEKKMMHSGSCSQMYRKVGKCALTRRERTPAAWESSRNDVREALSVRMRSPH